MQKTVILKWIEGITGPEIFQDLNAPENTVNTADVLRRG